MNRNPCRRLLSWELNEVCRAGAYSALLFVLAFSISAQQTERPGEQGGPDTIGGGVQDPAAVERGQKSFEATCAFCHGPDARGRSGPDLVRSAVVLRDVKGDQIGEVIRNGRRQRGMPAFALSQAQVEDLAAFLHSRTHLAANRFTYVISGVVTGDAAAGKAYFDGAGKCNTCHSPEKDLAHIATKYDPVELQSRFLSPPSPEDRDLIRGEKPASATRVTIELASGDSISGTLLQLDTFDVALVDSAGWYRSYPRAGTTVTVHDPLEFHRQLIPQYSDTLMHNMLAYLETLK